MPPARTLLLVDDDATTRDLLTLVLTHAGWQVATAPNGEAAIAALAEATPSAVLCDLQMPGLSGTALATAIRGQSTTPVLLAMTATATAGLPHGFDALLIKPFGADAVERQYEAALHQVSHASTPAAAQQPELDPVFDPATLAGLGKAMPHERLVALLAFVADDAGTRVTRMAAAAGDGDDSTFRKEAHALKGSCAMVGAARLKQLASVAEDEGLPNAPLTQSKSIADFVQAIQEIRLMLDTLSFGDTRPTGHDQ